MTFCFIFANATNQGDLGLARCNEIKYLVPGVEPQRIYSDTVSRVVKTSHN